MMRKHRERGAPVKDRDTADRQLAQEAERQRDRVSHGCDGARRPEEKFPIEEAADADEPVHKTPHKRHYRQPSATPFLE